MTRWFLLKCVYNYRSYIHEQHFISTLMFQDNIEAQIQCNMYLYILWKGPKLNQKCTRFRGMLNEPDWAAVNLTSWVDSLINCVHWIHFLGLFPPQGEGMVVGLQCEG